MNLPGPQTCAIAASLLITSIILLAYGADERQIPLDDLDANLDGAHVVTDGILTSLRIYDSGVEVLMLISESGRSTIKVVCTPSASPPPSSCLCIGCMTQVSGDLSCTGDSLTLFSSYDRILLIAPSERTLDLYTLQSSWQLFEGDRFNLTGYVHLDDLGYRLWDESHNVCMTIWPQTPLGSLQEGLLTLDCTLILDREEFIIGLRVWAFHPPA